jgi:tripartite-type tricarboxylate transporter receptor subunit TctC
MFNRRQFRLFAAATAAAALFAPSTSAAEDWPARPLTMVYPFAAGSAGDVMGRLFASRLSELLGQSVIFENVSGAGGMTGASRVARAAPDGYQILLGGTAQTLKQTPSFNVVTDLAPVALTVEQPIVLIVRDNFKADDLTTFIASAKANQTAMQYGSTGAGSVVHLACALLNAAIGVNVVHVPYRGGADAMRDLIAARIDYQCIIAAAALPQIESKKVKAIAMLSKARSPSLPNLPSAHEQGVTNFDVNSWYGFFLSKPTPAAIVQKIHAATLATMETPSVRQRLKEVGAEVVAPERRSSAYFASFVEQETARWAAAIKAANISMD